MLNRSLLAFLAPLLLAGCLGATVGGGDGGPVTGSAGPAGSQGTAALTKCPTPVATAAISSQRLNTQYLIQYMGSQQQDPLPALRLVMHQSNCVTVVHRDIALGAMREERALASSGELKAGSNFGGGQMVAADYTFLLELTFSEENASGASVALGVLGMFVPYIGYGAAAAGNMRFSEAQALITMVDNRSGVQIAVSSGTGSGTSFGALGGIFGRASLSAGGYMKTIQGKVVIAAIADAWNGIVPHLQSAGVRTAKTSMLIPRRKP